MQGEALLWLPQALAEAGLHVVLYDGWEDRARSSGGFTGGKPFGVFWHHTASVASPSDDANYCCHGADARPLTNLLLPRDGSVWVLAAGATNTNGKGQRIQFSRGVVEMDQANTSVVGMEICNNGVGEAWPQVQIDAAFAASNAINRHMGNQPTDVSSHQHYAPDRKIDPATAAAVQGPWKPRSINSSGSWNVDDIRTECFERFDEAPDPTPIPPGDDDMKQIYYVVTGAHAKFIGIPPIVEWTGPGTDKTVAAIQKQLDLGNLVEEPLTGGPNAFSYTFLRGPLPEGDSLHTWTGDEFAGRIG